MTTVNDLHYAHERAADAAFDAHQDRLADEADEREANQLRAERNGFDVGDRVTVGKGAVLWVIESFTNYPDQGWHAHLEPYDGYTKSTVHVDRLRRPVLDEHLGFVQGEKVTVGEGRVAFIITGFGIRANGQHYAELTRADGAGRFAELANVDRLKRVA